MNYDSNTDSSPEKRNEFIKSLIEKTVAAFKFAKTDAPKLQAAVQQYISTAGTANLDLEEIENILGVNESCIMDLADLSDADEEIVIDAFEQFVNT